MSSPPGMLYVTMQPQPSLPAPQFHEWYNNEHGPTRLRLPAIFPNGLRYAATNGREPHFLAAYDVTSMSQLETDTYLTLRANRSPREAATIGQVDVTRYFWDLVASRASPLFMPIEKLSDEESEGLVLVAVQLKPKEGVEGAEAEVEKWYKEEHMELLSRVPGWLRTRFFKTSTLEKGRVATTYIGLHDYAKTNGLGGPEHKASMATEWRERAQANFFDLADRRVYSLFYTFGPAPRDLKSLSQLPASETSTFKSADAKTVTTNSPAAVITSYVTADDGQEIPYRLEGNPDPKAPTIAFCNSLLTSLHMWDRFVEILKVERPQYRLLRYDVRGRHAVPSGQPVTLDRAADDLNELLDALRIPKLAVLIGVSMGGATTTKFALKYLGRLEKFIACDFNVTSSAANTEAWKGRVAMARKTLEDGRSGINELAPLTVERWFHPATKKEVVEWMTGEVAGNDVEGFAVGCQALWNYDLKPELKGCAVPGLLVVGEGDGKGALVKAMDGFKGLIGEGGMELRIVPEAGHLPMCESPQGFWEAVKETL